jgi:hypothetical protein
MNTRTAAPVVITVSLVVLMSGCAGAAAQGGQVRDDLRPAANAAAVGLARGHVISQDALSPNHVVADRVERAIQEAAQSDAARAFSAEARRELHAQAVQAEPAPAFSADARRELHSQAVESSAVTRWSPDARRELHAGQPVTTTTADAFTAAEIRELKGSASVEVDDDLSPLGDGTSEPAPAPDTVDDDLSPMGSIH